MALTELFVTYLMISKIELEVWLKTIRLTSSIAIDDGGLTLVEIDQDGQQTTAYLEIGGVPRNETD